VEFSTTIPEGAEAIRIIGVLLRIILSDELEMVLKEAMVI